MCNNGIDWRSLYQLLFLSICYLSHSACVSRKHLLYLHSALHASLSLACSATLPCNAAAPRWCRTTVECLDVQTNAGEVSELTLGYNFGRLHEANGDLKQAQTLFSVSPSCSYDHNLRLCKQQQMVNSPVVLLLSI